MRFDATHRQVVDLFEKDLDLPLQDDRLYLLTKLPRCPECHSFPMLKVEQAGRLFHPTRYRLGCPTSVNQLAGTCCSGPWTTPWLMSSRECTAIWWASYHLSKR